MTDIEYKKIVILDRVDDHINKARTTLAGLILDLTAQMNKLRSFDTFDNPDIYWEIQRKIDELEQLVLKMENI